MSGYILYTHPPSSTEYSGEVVWICQAKAPLTCLANGIPVEVNFQETSILDTCRKRTGVLHLRLLLLFVLMSAWFYEIVFTSATSAKCLTVFLHKCRSLITLIINSFSFRSWFFWQRYYQACQTSQQSHSEVWLSGWDGACFLHLWVSWNKKQTTPWSGVG